MLEPVTYSCGTQSFFVPWSGTETLTAAPFRFPFIRHRRRSSSMQLTAVRLRKHGGTSERTVEKPKEKRQTLEWVSVFLAPQTGLEPVTPRLTAACSTDWAIKAFKVFYHLSHPKVVLCRHRLIFPGRFQPSIVSTDELNYRVRDGNGWTLIAKNTDYLNFSSRSLVVTLRHGDPYEIRTRVAGVRGRSLRPLDQRAT